MNILQKIYNAIKNFHSPQWLKDLTKTIQDIIISILLSVGRDALNQIEAKIVEVAGKDISNKQKFQIVFNFTKDLLPQLKDSVINTLIEVLVQKFKQSGYEVK